MRKGGERHAAVTRLPFPILQRSPVSGLRQTKKQRKRDSQGWKPWCPSLCPPPWVRRILRFAIDAAVFFSPALCYNKRKPKGPRLYNTVLGYITAPLIFTVLIYSGMNKTSPSRKTKSKSLPGLEIAFSKLIPTV